MGVCDSTLLWDGRVMSPTRQLPALPGEEGAEGAEQEAGDKAITNTSAGTERILFFQRASRSSRSALAAGSNEEQWDRATLRP